MSDGFNSWWRTRTLREQRLLLAMAGLALIVFAWLLVVRPLGDALSAAKERHAEAAVALAEARGQAARLAALEKAAPPALTASVDMLVSQSAAEAGFPLSRIDREGANQATVVIDAVRPQAFFGWVGQLESGSGLIVDRLSATTNSDQTLAVQITFRARAG